MRSKFKDEHPFGWWRTPRDVYDLSSSAPVLYRQAQGGGGAHQAVRVGERVAGGRGLRDGPSDDLPHVRGVEDGGGRDPVGGEGGEEGD